LNFIISILGIKHIFPATVCVVFYIYYQEQLHMSIEYVEAEANSHWCYCKLLPPSAWSWHSKG